MKFIKITSKHTKEQLNALMSNMSNTELDVIESLYSKFQYVEFTDEVGNECMYAVIQEKYIVELFDVYVNFSVNFVYEDMTKEALYSSIITNDADVISMLESYIDANLDVDVVLDKILDLGRESLTDKDILVLSNA